ncbi:MAG: ABC transporter ATP-binding protein [Pseudomonadales bacterium]
MLSVSNFTKSFGPHIAVHNLSFQADSGQILGLVGPNGAGKSTTLGAIAGIVAPNTGRLTVANHDVVKAPLQAKFAMGYIPDEPPLFEELTIWEHMVFIASVYGVAHFEGAAQRLLNSFQLFERRHQVARTLSRGMRQKVSVMCAYLHNPSVLLFDEPMVGLDPGGIRTLHQSIQQRAAAGATIVVSSHMLSLVQDLCTHVLVLHEGQQRWHGSIEELNKQGATALEALFFSITESSVEA